MKRPAMANSDNNSMQQSSFDRLVTVEGYDIPQKIMFAVDDNGKKFEVRINEQSFRSAEDSVQKKGLKVDTLNWMGHNINKKMAEAHPAGSRLILKKTKVLKRDNGNGYAVTEADRIAGVPNPEADKTFQGVFTLSGRTDENRDKRVSRVHHWPTRGIDINDDVALQKIAKEMDEAIASSGMMIGKDKVTVPTIGVQFRALLKTDRKQPDDTPVYEAVDTSLPFSWVSEEGENGKKTGHALTGAEMMELREGYISYISEHEQFKNHLDDMIVEVCPYRSYPASINDKLRLTTGDPRRDANADKNPLFQLCYRKSFVDMAQTVEIQGNNNAVNGIIQISKNKLVKIDGKPQEVPSYWVSDLHANHTKGHVHAFIRTSEGFKVEPHANLKLQKNDALTNQQPQQPQQQQNTRPVEQNQQPMTQQRTSAPAVPAPAPAPVSMPVDDGDGFDPFADTPTDNAAAAPATKPIVKFGKRN